MGEVTLQELESNLEAASERLGLALKNAPADDKKTLSSIYDKIKDLAAKQAAESGESVDASALFAAAVVGSENLTDKEVVEAAINYIDQDLAYCRFRSANK